MTKTEKNELREHLCGLTAHISTNLETKRKILIGCLRGLAEKLESAANKLEAYPNEKHRINCLGEVQGQGSDIDRLCGEYALLLETRELTGWYIGEATK